MAIAVLVSSLYGWTLAPGLSLAHYGSDGGDLITAAAIMGVAHPTGYPTYLGLAWLFQQLPVSQLAFRTNLLSATAAVFAVLGTAQLIRTLIPQDQDGWCSRYAATVGALSLAVAPLFWSQALIAEVYSLHTLFVVLLLCFMALTLLTGLPVTGTRLLWQGVIAGLALGNHLTIALFVLAWLISGLLGDGNSAGGLACAGG